MKCLINEEHLFSFYIQHIINLKKDLGINLIFPKDKESIIFNYYFFFNFIYFHNCTTFLQQMKLNAT